LALVFRILALVFRILAPASFLIDGYYAAIDRIHQHVVCHWVDFVTRKNDDVIEHLAGLREFAWLFPMFTNQTTFEHLARGLTGGDLNCLIHTDLRDLS